MMQSDLQQLEVLCQAFYGDDHAQREQANAVLQPMVDSLESIPQWQGILAHSNNLQALLFATAALTNLYTYKWSNITSETKEQTRQFLLNYLFQRGPDLLQGAPAVLGQFVRFLCRIVKLSWLDDIANQTIVEQVNHFLQSSTPHWIIGLHIYSALTQDVQPKTGANMSRDRRIALSFRDNALIDIFKVSIETLEQYNTGALRVPESMQETKLLKQILELTLDCLSYDFMASVPDETSDEQHTIMIPHSWAVLKDVAVPKLFFSIYEHCLKYGPGGREDCARICLSILLIISALRRSFFNQDDLRQQVVGVLIEGTSHIVKNQLGLHIDDCYHELCRLIGKVNSICDLPDLIRFPSFLDWIEQLFRFTISSMDDWRRLPNSKHYLLKFWSHMIITGTTMAKKGSKIPFYFEDYIEQVTIAFILSRLKLAEEFALRYSELDEVENPLQNEISVHEQMESISELARCHFKQVVEKVLQLFEDLQLRMHNQACTPAEFQEKAAWLVYIIGGLIGAHNSDKFGDVPNEDKIETDLIVGKICNQVFGLMQQSNQYPEYIPKLDAAYIYFLGQFRKLYIEIHARKCLGTEPIDALLNGLGVSTEDGVLDLMLGQIIFNFQNRAPFEGIIKDTLSFFLTLAGGIHMIQNDKHQPHFFMTGKQLLQNATAKFMLENHSDPIFTFCNVRKYGKYRTKFKYILSKLLFLDIKLNSTKFDEFLAPMAQIFDQIWTSTAGGQNFSNLRSDEGHKAIVNLAHDLKGVSEACEHQQNYTMLLNWVMQKQSTGEPRIHLFNWAIEVWWDDCEVCIPILKFMAEFVHNRGGRIEFKNITAKGVMLLKEVSSMHMNYGTKLLMSKDFGDIYRRKYKTTALALFMFYHLISGNYIYFDILEVYSDQSLLNALNLCLQMCLAIPRFDLQAYEKPLRSFYLFLELATKSYMNCVINLTPASFAELMLAIEDGLCSFEAKVFMSCCGVVSNTVTFLLENKEKETTEEGQWAIAILKDYSQIFKRILQLLFDILITGEKQRLWTLSSSIFALILLFNDEFHKIENHFIQQQINQKRQADIRNDFFQLMKDIEPNILNHDNKNTFSHNLYRFASNFRSINN